MERKRFYRIAITGDPGSGKSTFAGNVEKHTGFKLITTGQMFRDLAAKRGVTVTELNKLAETQKDIDKEVDDYLVSLNDAKEDLILDSRMAWHFVKDALKIRLTLSPERAAGRIFRDKGAFRESYPDIETAAREVERRRNSEVDRYQMLYGVDISDAKNFDLVIDTASKTPEEVFEEFLVCFNAYQARFEEKQIGNG